MDRTAGVVSRLAQKRRMQAIAVGSAAPVKQSTSLQGERKWT
jgi:hypothetical protein